MDVSSSLPNGRACASPSPSSQTSSHLNHGTLQELLEINASASPPRGLIIYPPGDFLNSTFISYRTLSTQARAKSEIIRGIKGYQPTRPVLLHFNIHWDNILWFWATLYAGAIPVFSSPFSNVAEHRQRHIQALCNLLEDPICLTTTKSLHFFDCKHNLTLHTVEDLLEQGNTYADGEFVDEFTSGDDTAMLMLTSGSTGDAKAVRLKHRHVLASVAGKNGVHDLPSDKPFLNWIGMDHVGALTEIHLHALYHGVDQVHVHASDLLYSPRVFLDLLSRHEISRSFAPNFFLAKLVALPEAQPEVQKQDWNFSNLRFLVSGGEANDIETCIAVSTLLANYGATPNAVAPGFGMTETCAGSIYNLKCPDYDVTHNHAFASLGRCIKGMYMRVTNPTATRHNLVAAPDEPGDLEVRGEMVFEDYYRNEAATTEAFTLDGWFRTGDRAVIDSNGYLNLIGRTKDVMNINGVKVNPTELQSSIEQALGTWVTQVICYPTRSAGSHTEQVTITYVPKQWPLSAKELAKIDKITVQTCLQCTGSSPVVFALPDAALLPTTTLGKIPRSKMRTLFETGIFDEHIQIHRRTMEAYRLLTIKRPANDLESSLLRDFAQVLDLDEKAVGVDEPIFHLGVTSIDLIRLKRRIDQRMLLDVPIITFINNPTVRSLAQAIDETNAEYDPVVVLRNEGPNTPLWLVHPGVGEILIFLGLSAHIHDRPVYALRARGFDGEPRFADIAEAVDTYCTAIKSHQPEGPYAIAGYSYGTMLAFEIAKVLGSEGAEIRFLGSFNLPPHIKYRMQQLTWNMCLLHLAYFLGLISEDFAESLEKELEPMTRDDALAKILGVVDASRLEELGLTQKKVVIWTDVAHGLQGMAVDYEPSGSAVAMDVFHAIPLRVAAKSRQDWLENHLGKWKDFCHTEPRFHEVEGAHYTMIGPDHVASFASTLREALKARGL